MDDGQNTQDSQLRNIPPIEQAKAESRRNALKHGLTATTLLPEILVRDLVCQLYDRLREEWRPATPTEKFFVREMARHQAALERIEQIEEASLRRSARGALHLIFDTQEEADPAEAALAGAGTADAIERVSRYRRAHERGFLRSLTMLRDLKALSAAREEQSAVSKQADPQPFTTEAQCESYLIERWTGADVRCPRCGGHDGSWIPSRKVWQCRGCRRQSTLRSGTVMEGSRLSLLAWFRAIKALLADPSLTTAELAELTGLRRVATVRGLARGIRQAIGSNEATGQLAGLNRAFGPEPRC